MNEREALTHLRTLIDVAADSDDIEGVQKLLVEMRRIVDKALAEEPSVAKRNRPLIDRKRALP